MGFIKRSTVQDSVNGAVIDYYRDDTDDAGPGTAGRGYIKVDGVDSQIYPGNRPIHIVTSQGRYMAIPMDPGDIFTLPTEAVTGPNNPLIFRCVRKDA